MKEKHKNTIDPNILLRECGRINQEIYCEVSQPSLWLEMAKRDPNFKKISTWRLWLNKIRRLFNIRRLFDWRRY